MAGSFTTPPLYNEMMTVVSASIFRSAAVAGIVALALGIFAPTFLSGSNIGPLFGVFFSGPAGAALGALYAIGKAALEKREMRMVVKWLAGVWIATLLYTLFALTISRLLPMMFVGVQVVILVTSAIVFRDRRSRSIILALLTFIPITILFPPVIRAWWSPQLQPRWTGPIPKFTFILNPLLDASHHVPVLAIHKSMLLLEWFVAILIALVLCFVIERRNGGHDPAVRTA